MFLGIYELYLIVGSIITFSYMHIKYFITFTPQYLQPLPLHPRIPSPYQLVTPYAFIPFPFPLFSSFLLSEPMSLINNLYKHGRGVVFRSLGNLTVVIPLMSDSLLLPASICCL